MKTVYPTDPPKDFNAWMRYIAFLIQNLKYENRGNKKP